MRRIQLGDPYEEFIARMISSGYYSTATEVIRDALRLKMREHEDNRIAQIHALVAEGQASVDRGEVVPIDDKFVEKLNKAAEESNAANEPIPDYLKPQ